MSLIRSIEAKFVAQARGLKSTIQGVKKDIGGLEKKTKTFSNKMNNDFRRGSRSAATHLEKFALGTQKNFETIGNVLNTTSNKFGEWSRDIKSFGKTTSKALSPLTAFYATAAITGGKRMIANEQLDILMRNVFRTEKAYESAWDSVKGLTKGTAFMNSDVGQWLSQLVQSNIELGKSEDIMKSILDFSVGSGQIGIEGEIHDIIMKAIRSGGWDQMTLDMLAQRGLNLAGHIANVLGITTESAQDMLKDGSISMEESLDYFVDAVQVGSEGAGGYFASMADSAKEGGETMTGAWINVKAALAQLGEDMWKSGAWDQLKTALNNITDFLYELSPALEPMAKIIASIMATMVGWVQKLMTAFINLRPKTQALIASLSVIGAVLGPAIYLFGSFVGVISKILKPLGLLFTGMSKVSGAIGKLAGAFGKGGLQGVITAVGSKLPWLSRLFTVLTGPVGIVIGVITLLGSAFYAAYKKSEPLRNALSKTGGLFKDIYTNIKEAIPWFDIFTFTTNGLKNAFGWLFDGVKLVSDFLIKGLGFALSIAVKGLNLLLGAVKVVTENLGTFVSAIKKLFTGDFKGAFDDLLTGISDIFFGLLDLLLDFIIPIKDKAVEIGKVIVFSIIDWVSSLYGKTKNYFMDFVNKFGGHIVALKDIAVEKLSNVTTAFVKWAKELPGKVKDGLINLKDAFVTRLGDTLEVVGDFSRKYGKIIIDGLKRLPGDIKKGLSTAKEVLTDWLKDQNEQNKKFYGGLGKKIKKWLSSQKKSIVQGFNTWKKGTTTFFKELPGDIKKHTINWWKAFSENFLERKDDIVSRLSEWKDSLTEFFKTMPGVVRKYVVDWWTEFKQGFLDKKDEVVSKLGEWKDSIFDFFKSVPSLIKKQVSDWWKSFKDGFLDKKNEIVSGFTEWKKGITEWFTSMTGSIKKQTGTFAKSFKEGIKEKKDAIVEGFSSWWEGIKNWFSGLGKKKEIKDTGKTIVKNVSEGAEEQKDDLMSKIGSIILDIPKYMLMIAGVLFLSVGRELIKRLSKGMNETKSSVTKIVSNLWDNVKKIFSSKSKEIYNNLKDTFIGRIVTSVINFSKSFVNTITKMWSSVKSKFLNGIKVVWEWMKNSFIGRIITSIINFSKSFRTNLSKMWTLVKSLFTKRINEIYQSVKNSFVGRIISNIINFAKNFRTNISNMWTSVKSIFSKWIGNIRNSIANSFVGRMLSSVRNLKTNFVKIAKEMWQGVKRQFGNIVDGAKALPGRIGRGIRGAKSKAVNAMKGVGNNLITWAGKPYNKVVDGVNWITSKLGISKNIDPWPIPQYAKGTKGAHPGGPALVNDGRNRLSGEELIVLPDGSTGMFEGKDVVANLPEGTHIFSAPDTRDMLNDVPQYAKGTDSTQGFLDKGSNMVGGSAKKRTWKDKVWDYIKKPSKLLDIALDKFGAKLPGNTAMFKDMLKGGFNTIKDAALDKVKSTFKKQEKTEHNPNYFPSGGMLLGASGGSRSVSNPWGVHDYLYNIAKHIMRSPLGRGLIITSGYRASSNTDHGKRNAIDLSGFGRNGGYGAVARWASRLPRVSYTIGDNVVYGRKYGDGGRPSWARGHMNHLHVSGYEDGGIINTKQLAWIAEGGWAESIISHDPAKYNSQKAIWQKTGDALGFTDDKGNKEILAKLERIANAVEQDKDFVVNMDSKQVGELVEQHVTHKQTRRSRRKRRASN